MLTTEPIMQQLRERTADLHRHAESRPLQRSLAKGELPRELFAHYLGQLFLVHQALERELRSSAASHTAIPRVFSEAHQREDDLRYDLQALGVDAARVSALKPTEHMLQSIQRLAIADPVALLGMHYVLEGSMNGNRFIARAIARSYGLAPGSPGLLYLDPYGARQTEVWQAYKAAMDAIGFDAPQGQAVVDAAMTMFNAIAEIADAVMGQGVRPADSSNS